MFSYIFHPGLEHNGLGGFSRTAELCVQYINQLIRPDIVGGRKWIVFFFFASIASPFTTLTFPGPNNVTRKSTPPLHTQTRRFSLPQHPTLARRLSSSIFHRVSKKIKRKSRVNIVVRASLSLTTETHSAVPPVIRGYRREIGQINRLTYEGRKREKKDKKRKKKLDWTI